MKRTRKKRTVEDQLSGRVRGIIESHSVGPGLNLESKTGYSGRGLGQSVKTKLVLLALPQINLDHDCFLFLKSVENIQVSLKYGKNSGVFT
jgi:hypothetical protein